MKHITLFFSCLCSLLSLTTQASSAPHQNNTILHDLNGDGVAETIAWIKYTSTDDLGDFYQLRVYSSQGKLMWAGPKGTDIDNPLILGDWDFGSSFPELAADIDNDGAVELLIPEPQSDVSPTQFRVLRWSNNQFSFVHSKILLEEMRRSGLFLWSKTKVQEGAWISSFSKVHKKGLLEVHITELRSNSPLRSGVALVSSSKKGFEVKSWLFPMENLTDPPMVQSLPNPTPASKPQQGYIARLSLKDHYNSAGTQLLSVGDILRQDRAHFYKSKGDKEDQADPYFNTFKKRESMLRRKLVPVGPHSSDAKFRAWWKNTILRDAPLVEVEVTPQFLRVKILKPHYQK